MMDLLIFTLVAYGISNIAVFGSIFEGFRNFMGVNDNNPRFFGKLLGCMMCLPFWVGVILSVIMYSPTAHLVQSHWLSMFFDGCLASGCVWLIHTIQEKLES